MEETPEKNTPLCETAEIQNLSNVNDLKDKLNEIINEGEEYKYDVYSCLVSLLSSSDYEILTLTIKAISELVKCEENRKKYATKEVIEPILKIIANRPCVEKLELYKQCCRSLGNLCCDCDESRKILISCNGVAILGKLLESSLEPSLKEIKFLVAKTLRNFCLGGSEFCKAILKEHILDNFHKIMTCEVMKVDMDDDLLSSVLIILSVVNENNSEIIFSEDINKAVLSVLRETANMEISELCLDHLHTQAEDDTVKMLIANEGGLQLVCSRLEQLMASHNAGELNANDAEVEAIIKQACDLIIIVLTGDAAMNKLYNKGKGEVYLTMIEWLKSPSHHLLGAAVMAIGNFARQDTNCIQMMDDFIYNKLLDIFETYYHLGLRIQNDPDASYPVDAATVTKIQQGALSALRNISVPVANKQKAAANGRATSLLLDALPNVTDHQVAYKLLATLRMLMDGQAVVCGAVCARAAALRAACSWAVAAGGAGAGGAGGEAPRLLARAAAQLARSGDCSRLLQVEECTSCIVNMLLSSHSIMQNEAILALTLIAIQAFNKPSDDEHCKTVFINQLIKSEIGKHISILVDTNCAKMPFEVAQNLIAFLDITSKKAALAKDYREAKVQDSLKKFSQTREDLGADLEACLTAVIGAIDQ